MYHTELIPRGAISGRCPVFSNFLDGMVINHNHPWFSLSLCLLGLNALPGNLVPLVL